MLIGGQTKEKRPCLNSSNQRQEKGEKLSFYQKKKNPTPQKKQKEKKKRMPSHKNRLSKEAPSPKKRKKRKGKVPPPITREREKLSIPLFTPPLLTLGDESGKRNRGGKNFGQNPLNVLKKSGRQKKKGRGGGPFGALTRGRGGEILQVVLRKRGRLAEKKFFEKDIKFAKGLLRGGGGKGKGGKTLKTTREKKEGGGGGSPLIGGERYIGERGGGGGEKN